MFYTFVVLLNRDRQLLKTFVRTFYIGSIELIFFNVCDLTDADDCQDKKVSVIHG